MNIDDQDASLDGVRAEARQYQAQLAAAQDSIATDFEGTDSTGAVQVIVDQAGAVRSVAIDQNWASVLDANGLGFAVREAVEAAGLARLQLWAEVATEPLPEGTPVAAPAPSASAFVEELHALMGSTSDGDDSDLPMDELLDLLTAVNASLDAVTAEVQAHATQEFKGRSKGGNVTVTVLGGGDPVAVSYDKRWLVNAHEYNISRETTEAFQAAYQAAGERDTNKIIAASPLGELQALSRDPAAAAQRFRRRR